MHNSKKSLSINEGGFQEVRREQKCAITEKYTGHLPNLQDEIGSRYSVATHRSITHSTTVDEQQLILPQPLCPHENREELKEETGAERKPKDTENTTDTEDRSILQRAADILIKPLFDDSCCRKDAVLQETKSRSESFEIEPESFEPSVSSVRFSSPCVHCSGQCSSKPQSINSQPKSQRSNEYCNEERCRSSYPAVDGPDVMEKCVYCPAPTPSASRCSTHAQHHLRCSHHDNRATESPEKYSSPGYQSGKEPENMFQPQIVPMYSTAGPPIYLRHEGLPPKYGGHIPGINFSYGKTFGRATTDAKRYLVEDDCR